MTAAVSRPSPHPTSAPPVDDLAALLTAVHNEKHHRFGEPCPVDERGRCNAIDRKGRS